MFLSGNEQKFKEIDNMYIYTYIIQKVYNRLHFQEIVMQEAQSQD